MERVVQSDGGATAVRCISIAAILSLIASLDDAKNALFGVIPARAGMERRHELARWPASLPIRFFDLPSGRASGLRIGPGDRRPRGAEWRRFAACASAAVTNRRRKSPGAAQPTPRPASWKQVWRTQSEVALGMFG